ncbi:autorepressor SdpR family transcription factor [Lactovum miscens]|uniref:DNA-binding transcriptional ArsR family regulator n=1 Tax=Lactovum miscens TaxID=190387 RepID=A0A841C524_9LACT|nr:DNA-binding transcriptional ArsR family regulator [Lactovum miscens]
MSLDLMFKALSDPTRRKIISMLRKEDMTAGDIAAKFNMTKPSISHHLKMLKQASLVLDERNGQKIIYTLNTSVFQEIVSWIFDLGNLHGSDNE